MKTLRLLKILAVRAYHAPWVNRYFIATLLFFTWMVFFDKHNVVTQLHLKHAVDKLEHDIEIYDTRYKKALQDQQALKMHTDQYARENYYMHKSDEEVFIIYKD